MVKVDSIGCAIWALENFLKNKKYFTEDDIYRIRSNATYLFTECVKGNRKRAAMNIAKVYSGSLVQTLNISADDKGRIDSSITLHHVNDSPLDNFPISKIPIYSDQDFGKK